MDPTTLYTICVLGVLAIYLLIRPGARPLKAAGTILGLGALAWLVVFIGRTLAPGEDLRPEFFFSIFGLIAIASAIRMITHSRPVYAALYFVMVVLASAGLFLLLAAEFMAFALVIVYAGAILVTYMFVLMLAQQSPTPDDPSGQPEYDRKPREPAMAAVVGFVLLAVLGHLSVAGPAELPEPPSRHQATLIAQDELNQMPREVEAILEEIAPGAEPAPDEDGRIVFIRDEQAFARVRMIEEDVITEIALPADAIPGNIQRVGLALVAVFPVSLELAGIILLLAMFGAVVLARRQIELGEDELREAAGMERITAEDDTDHESGEPSPGGGR